MFYPSLKMNKYKINLTDLMERLHLINETISNLTPHYDFIIVGAGISGMQAADILASHPNTKILILEAQNILGGRIKSLTLADLEQAKKAPWIWNDIQKYKSVNIEAGATYIEDRHLVLTELCKQFSIQLRPQYSQGSCNYLAERPYSEKQLMNSSKYASKIKEVIDIIDKISDQYNKHIFNNLSDMSMEGKALLKKYDAITVDQFLKSVLPDNYPHVRDIFDGFLEHTECISTKQNSMHEVLTKNARSNDVGILKAFLGEYGDGSSYLVKGGTDKLISKFKDSIQRKIRNSIESILKLGEQVLTIDNRRHDFITVISQNTFSHQIQRHTCKKVICAVPLAVSKMISFTDISMGKKLIIDNQVRTNSVKSFIITKHPFWRRNSDGSLNSNGDNLFSSEYMVNMSHDISPTDLSCGILVFFHAGKRLDAWESQFPSEKDYQKKKQYLIDIMCKAFKTTEEDKLKYFEDCIYFQVSYMNNKFIRSGFQSNTRSGTFNQLLNIGDSINALYRDENGITFIGSEYSHQFPTYVEGAVRIARQKIFKLIGQSDPLAHLQIN